MIVNVSNAGQIILLDRPDAEAPNPECISDSASLIHSGFGRLSVYLSVRGAGEAAVVSGVTGRVLQAEAGLVSLSHLPLSVGVQQLVQAELVHAVEVTERQREVQTPAHPTETLVERLNVAAPTCDSCATPRRIEAYWAGSRMSPGSSPAE